LLSYLNDVNDTLKVRAKYAVEASNMYNLLIALRYQLEASKSAGGWYSKVRRVAFDQGPLDQFREASEVLVGKLTEKGKANKVMNTALWSSYKKAMKLFMDRMERLKSHIQGILQLAQLYVPLTSQGRRADRTRDLTVRIKSDTDVTMLETKDEETTLASSKTSFLNFRAVSEGCDRHRLPKNSRRSSIGFHPQITLHNIATLLLKGKLEPDSGFSVHQKSETGSPSLSKLCSATGTLALAKLSLQQ
jgi:hypothetical protein